jgi:hypothetical protein
MMLSFRLPVTALYHLAAGGRVSPLAAIPASVIALFVACRSRMGIAALRTGSVCMARRSRGCIPSGWHEAAGDLPLLGMDGGGGGGAGNCDFTGGAVADILFPEKDERVELVEGGERAGDGSGGPGDALHGNGDGEFHAASTETQDSYALRISGLRLESVILVTFMVLAVKLTDIVDG